MKQQNGFSGIRLVVIVGICSSFLLLDRVTTQAEVFVHHSPLSFTWETPQGQVDHYNVYVSVDNQPYDLTTEVTTTSFQLDAEDGKQYVLQVEAEDALGNIGPMSDPSSTVVVKTCFREKELSVPWCRP